MKILIADFSITRYGGIIEHVVAKAKSLKALGHEVDIAQLSPAAITVNGYKRKLQEFESGIVKKERKINSQSGGYELDEVTGYWKNNYYGFFLPPSNRIGVFEKDALERWRKLIKDVDLILWNFIPTRSNSWGAGKKDFSFWWKFLDIDNSKTKQVFTVHDAYFDVRASNISALKDKFLFLECAHIAAYKCCENIAMPRILLLNPRYMEDSARMPINLKRENDFFAAHIFKSMKHMEELIRAVPYIDGDVTIAGGGIEQMYMVAPVKIKPCYVCNSKNDPDYKGKGKISIWDRAVKYGMEYLGLIDSRKVNEILLNTKFAIDPSWCTHYAKYCKTHINGFIIEAMLHGCYPVLRDYSGLDKNVKKVYDPLFDNIRAVYIPWDVTPKQFAEYLNRAKKEITSAEYIKDTKHNFDLVKQVFNSTENCKEMLKYVTGKKYIDDLEIGEDSEVVKNVTQDIMENFYNIKLPIKWEY